MEHLIIGIIVALAGGWVVYRLREASKPRASCGKTGCGGCATAAECSEQEARNA